MIVKTRPKNGWMNKWRSYNQIETEQKRGNALLLPTLLCVAGSVTFSQFTREKNKSLQKVKLLGRCVGLDLLVIRPASIGNPDE